jgi:hypothetical protein
MNYFTMDNLVDRVHAWWTGAGLRGPPWTDGGTNQRHRSMASGHSGARKLARRGHNRERGTRGTWLGPHWGSSGGEVADQRREMAVAVGARWGGSCGLRSKQRRAGVSVVMAGGAPRPFIVAGEGHIGARKGKTTDGNCLNTTEGGAA